MCEEKKQQQNIEFRWPFSHVLIKKILICAFSNSFCLRRWGQVILFLHSCNMSKNQIAVIGQYFDVQSDVNDVEISFCWSKRFEPCFWGSIRKDLKICYLLFYCPSWNFCRFLKQKERTLSPGATGILWDVAQAKLSFLTLRRYKATSVSGP